MILKHLQERGVLGINKRNADYILLHNPRKFYPRVDNKQLTKTLAEEALIAVPELYAVVERASQVDSLPELLARHREFVIKPASGSGGNGILVIDGRMKELYRKASAEAISWEELRYHVLNILSGMFSLGGRVDKALIEYRVQFDPVFEKVSYLGVPDIRIVVFLGVPVMAMIRLPTKMSDGKANLHQGAVGAGICLATGQTFSGVWRDSIIEEHPDTGESIVGLQIPHWDKLLEIAARCDDFTGLGYQGIDIVIDREKGPLLLELNARPGLNIQIANSCGLLPRLRLVEQSAAELGGLKKRIAFAKDEVNLLR